MIKWFWNVTLWIRETLPDETTDKSTKIRSIFGISNRSLSLSKTLIIVKVAKSHTFCEISSMMIEIAPVLPILNNTLSNLDRKIIIFNSHCFSGFRFCTHINIRNFLTFVDENFLKLFRWNKRRQIAGIQSKLQSKLT